MSFACLTQAGSSGEVPGPANLSSWMAANADVALPQAAKIMNAAKAEIRENRLVARMTILLGLTRGCIGRLHALRPLVQAKLSSQKDRLGWMIAML